MWGDGSDGRSIHRTVLGIDVRPSARLVGGLCAQMGQMAGPSVTAERAPEAGTGARSLHPAPRHGNLIAGSTVSAQSVIRPWLSQKPTATRIIAPVPAHRVRGGR